MESKIPRAGLSMPYASSAQNALKINPEQTGIRTSMFRSSESLGNNILNNLITDR
jgi:hypothetical protein